MSEIRLPKFSLRPKRSKRALSKREFYLREVLRDVAAYLPEAIDTHGDECFRHDCDIPDRGRRLLAEVREVLK